MSKQWRAVKGWEGLYEVSDYGDIRSVDRVVTYKNGAKHFYPSMTKTLQFNKNGYVYVSLNCNKKMKMMKVSRIVAEAFIPNPKMFRDVNHKNGNKLDNRVSNLEWCSHQNNIRHRFDQLKKMKTSNVQIICRETKKRFSSIAEAARKNNIKYSILAHAVYRGHMIDGKHWDYIERKEQ